MKNTKNLETEKRIVKEQQPGEMLRDIPSFQVANLLNFLNCVERPEDIMAVVELPVPGIARQIAREILESRTSQGSLCTLDEVAALPSIDGTTLRLFLNAARHAIVPTPRLVTFGDMQTISPFVQPLLISGAEALPYIMACLVNGIRCGTNFYRLAVEKLAFLDNLRRSKTAERENKKRRRDAALAAGGTPTQLEQDIAQLDEDIGAIDQEINDLLGRDLHKAWAKLRANLRKRSDRLEKEINDAAKAKDKATAEAKSADKARVDKDIEKLDEEEPKK